MAKLSLWLGGHKSLEKRSIFHRWDNTLQIVCGAEITRKTASANQASLDLLPDTYNCGLRMRREWRGCISRHRLQREPLVSDPVMHHGTCVTHVPWCMSGLVTLGGGKNVPGIPGACATFNFTYLARGPWENMIRDIYFPNLVLLYTSVSQQQRGNDMCNLVLFEFSRIYPNHAGQLTTTMIVMMMIMMMAMMIMVMNEKRNDSYNDSNDNDSNNSKNGNDNDIQ